LREPRQVRDHQNLLLLVLPDKREHFVVRGMQEFQRPAPERLELLALRDHALHPPQERMRVVLLRLHVHGFVVILRIDIDGQVQPLRICP
jgi:hypothetical protein